ncbi:MAG: YHS domain-containing protein [Aquisalinus sp.]|nr:YHS domain-containing protein [Aquisalinus sp.]
MRRYAVTFLVFVITLPGFSTAYAEDPVYTGRFSNLALDGYDAVGYFTEGIPVKGSREYSYDYKGVTWLFSSADNRQLFVQDPVAYAPQYGGYCAWAISQNYTARGNPRNWTIVDGKLYLNFNDRIQSRWEANISEFIMAADQNWPGVLSK